LIKAYFLHAVFLGDSLYILVIALLHNLLRGLLNLYCENAKCLPVFMTFSNFMTFAHTIYQMFITWFSLSYTPFTLCIIKAEPLHERNAL